MAKTKGRSNESTMRPNRMRTQLGTSGSRRGVTTSEALISALMLGIVVSMLSGFGKTTRQGLRDRELSTRIDWEIVNLREQIGTWETARITVANIEAVPVSRTLSNRFDASKFSAQISELESPIRAKQVTLQFECDYLGQQIQPAELTFWVAEESVSTRAATTEADSNAAASAATTSIEAQSEDAGSDENSSGGSDD